jgi:hypothetical protein
VPTIGRFVSGWASLSLISAPVPRTTRLMIPVSSSIAPSILPCRQKLSAGLLPVAIFATARWMTGLDGPASTSARTDHTRPEKPGEPGIGVEGALDHVSRAAGEIGGQALGGFPFAAEQQNFVRRRVVAVGAYDGEAVFPGDRFGEQRVNLRLSQEQRDFGTAPEGARLPGSPSPCVMASKGGTGNPAQSFAIF